MYKWYKNFLDIEINIADVEIAEPCDRAKPFMKNMDSMHEFFFKQLLKEWKHFARKNGCIPYLYRNYRVQSFYPHVNINLN